MAMMHSPLGGQLWKSGAQAPTVVGGKTFTPVAWYPSSSDPKKGYTVCEVSDGTVSCNCMGWTRRNPPGGRRCKHTDDYIQYLRPLLNEPMTVGATAGPVIQEPENRKGGTLSELLEKLGKEGL